jgi:predicted RNA binding protein YcfA (HicA-like mRNA interferase family)
MKPLPFTEVIRRLKRAGFEVVAQRGSHVKLARATSGGVRTAVVPHHREVAAGTLRSILRQAGLSIDEFEKL